jgi:hypothetical protein
MAWRWAVPSYREGVAVLEELHLDAPEAAVQHGVVGLLAGHAHGLLVHVLDDAVSVAVVVVVHLAEEHLAELLEVLAQQRCGDLGLQVLQGALLLSAVGLYSASQLLEGDWAAVPNWMQAQQAATDAVRSSATRDEALCMHAKCGRRIGEEVMAYPYNDEEFSTPRPTNAVQIFFLLHCECHPHLLTLHLERKPPMPKCFFGCICMRS